MKNYNKLLLLSCCLPLLLIASPAFAALEVEFAATPLFSEAKIVPGDSVTRTVVVRNTGTTSESLEVLVENFYTGNLADSLQLTIDSPSSSHFADSLSAFFSVGTVPLGTLAPASEKTFSFTVAFPTSAGNTLMNTGTGFDLIIGFVGGEQVSDTPPQSPRGGSGTINLRLFNETVESVTVASSTALITWNSNLRATSYLVCGVLTATKTFRLTSAAPLFGYEFSIAEVALDTQDHELVVLGQPGTRYECRPAGRRNETGDFTVGQPVTFAFPAPVVLGVATTTAVFPFQTALLATDATQPEGQVLGDQVSLWPLRGSALGLGGNNWFVPGLIVLILTVGGWVWGRWRQRI